MTTWRGARTRHHSLLPADPSEDELARHWTLTSDDLAEIAQYKRERGATESLKVGSVIQRELMIAAGMAGIVVGGGLKPGLGPGPGLSATTPGAARSAPRPTRLPGTDTSFLNPNPTLFPVPVPYPRLPP